MSATWQPRRGGLHEEGELNVRPINILLVEDNPGDVRLTTKMGPRPDGRLR